MSTREFFSILKRAQTFATKATKRNGDIINNHDFRRQYNHVVATPFARSITPSFSSWWAWLGEKRFEENKGERRREGEFSENALCHVYTVGAYQF